MKTLTIEQVLKFRPCNPPYMRAFIKKLWAGRTRLTASDIAALDIKAADRIWALIRMMPSNRERRLFACDCAARAVRKFWTPNHPNDRQPQNTIAVARRFAFGRATREELSTASASAAAASSASSASSASAYAAYAAAASAAYAYASAAERKWQIKRAVKYVNDPLRAEIMKALGKEGRDD